MRICPSFKSTAACVAAVIVSVGLAACATTPAPPFSIDQRVESFDGTHTVELAPAPLYTGKPDQEASPYRMGALWNSASPDNVVLTLQYRSSTERGNLYTEFRGLDVNVGGQQQHFAVLGSTGQQSSPLQPSNDRQPGKPIWTSSNGSVAVPVTLFRQMLTASDVRLRIRTSNGYSDVLFSVDQMHDRFYARAGMKDMYARAQPLMPPPQSSRDDQPTPQKARS